MMVVPLILGAFTNTFLPGVLEIGGFTTALTRDGVLPLIAAFLVCMGAGIAVDEAPQSIEQGVAIIGAKFLVGVAIGLVVANVLGDSLFGLSSLAITAATTNTNGDLYAALVGELGNATDVLQDCIRVLIRADAVREATTHRRNVKGAATGSRGRLADPDERTASRRRQFRPRPDLSLDVGERPKCRHSNNIGHPRFHQWDAGSSSDVASRSVDRRSRVSDRSDPRIGGGRSTDMKRTGDPTKGHQVSYS
jgi:hypothetical protein